MNCSETLRNTCACHRTFSASATHMCPSSAAYCDRCDVLAGLGVLRVVAVERRDDGVLVIDVESPPGPAGCPWSRSLSWR